ncbi:MAG TPA: PAS domain S-box protein [Syntrophorhabdus sp.]|nr:PAS domain S-box protein [Syntrophorhabdus sp.]HOD76727.1 PAS domain S-box protein [Syntrophorhabdus sp.]HQH82197.1 PAS domain S-box protein [Syntrophorhabdus sp.]HQI96547.1 PAS domain S-box protein [Syntrophorhabdus sp.]HQM27425.1 PAS domain S-box protein [Syntrophorhabdus sp.]
MIIDLDFGLMSYQEMNREGLEQELKRLERQIGDLKASEERQRSVEKALRESEERYRSLVKQSSDGVYIFDPETARILEANDQFTKLLGYSEDEIPGLSLYDIVISRKEMIDASIRKVLRDGTYIYGLRHYRHKNGSVIDVEISGTLIHYGEAQVVMVNLRNVTERRKAEEKLRNQAMQLKEQAELLDIAEDAIIVLDMEDRIVFWNAGAEERYGWTKDEVKNQVSYVVLHTVFPEPLIDIKAKLAMVGRWEGELVQKKRSGEEIVVESRLALRRDQKNRPVAIMEINNDITERKQTQIALQRSKEELEARVAARTAELQDANDRLIVELNRRKRIEDMLRKGAERYRNLFVNSPLGIYRVNAEGRILMGNPTLIRMLGYSSFDELVSVGGKRRDYEPSYLRKKIKDRLEKEGRVRGFETKWRKRDKTSIFVRENAKAVRSPDGTLLYYEGTVEDITEQKKAEEKIKSYQKQLRSLASDLSLAEERERRRIATMLHDHIGQILAISKIKLGALAQLIGNDESMNQLKEVRNHIEQAIQYTRSLTFELSPPILYDLGLEAALEWLAEQVREHQRINCMFEADAYPKPVSDEIRIVLFSAVRELLMNVTKHAQANVAKITIRRVNDSITVHVADNGIGFVPSKMSFYRDENKGFGLFSIRERLRHLSGQMEVRSGRGRGTRVILTAPLVIEKQKAGNITNENQDYFGG